MLATIKPLWDSQVSNLSPTVSPMPAITKRLWDSQVKDSPLHIVHAINYETVMRIPGKVTSKDGSGPRKYRKC